jgi:hypothetical protein
MILTLGRTFTVAGVAFPDASDARSGGMGAFFDNHAHAIIAEGVRSLAEAKKLGDAWARKFRKGLVLAPCACEDMVEAGKPSKGPVTFELGSMRAVHSLGCNCEECTRGPIGLLPAAPPSAPAVLHLGHPFGRTIDDLESGRIEVSWRDPCPICRKAYAEHGRQPCTDATEWFAGMKAQTRQVRMRTAWLARERAIHSGTPRKEPPPIEGTLSSRIVASPNFSPEEKAICALCGHTRIEHLTVGPSTCQSCHGCLEFQTTSDARGPLADAAHGACPPSPSGEPEQTATLTGAEFLDAIHEALPDAFSDLDDVLVGPEGSP